MIKHLEKMDKYIIMAGYKQIKKRSLYLIVTLVLVTLFLSMYYLSNYEVIQKTVFQPPPYKTWMTIHPKIKTDESQVKVVENVEELFNGLLTEDEILTMKPCDDIQSLTSALKTKVFLQGGNREYGLNDRIKVTIIAYNNGGRPKKEGGDQFIATIRSDIKKAYSIGLVTDHYNGTYTVEFEAQWIGFAFIEIILTYTKEAIAALVRSRMKILEQTYTIATYQRNKTLFEDGYCHPDRQMLKFDEICTRETQVTKAVCVDEGLTPNRTQVCDFTSLNSGFPTYCLAPLSTNLKCKDWIYIRRRKSDTPNVGTTECEQVALRRPHIQPTNQQTNQPTNQPTTREIPVYPRKLRLRGYNDNRGIYQNLTQRISVAVVPKKLNDARKIIDLPTTSCSHYNKTKLWLLKEPTGFFYRGKWHLRHCKGIQINKECMRNKKLHFIGDSTMRQWFLNLLTRYKCKMYTEEWKTKKWYRQSECKNSELNFTSIYAIHSLPFHINGTANASMYLKSISQRLDKISNDANDIFVFHIFGHMTFYHPDHYRTKLEIIRDHVEKLLNRNKNVKIMFKSPHVFKQGRAIMGYIFNRIVYEVFGNLYDRVYYLNNRDSSTIFPINSIHPTNTIVDAMTIRCNGLSDFVSYNRL